MEIELARLSHVPLLLDGDVVVRDDQPDSSGQSLRTLGTRFPTPFSFQGSVRQDGAIVVVAGTVQGVASLECGRCLTWYDAPVTATFEARHAPALQHPVVAAAAKPARGYGVDPAGDEGIQLRPEDLDVSFLPRGATTLALEDVVREQVLLELPMRPLCREECRGLCKRCGADLNDAPCGCPQDGKGTGDPRLAALEALRRRLPQA